MYITINLPQDLLGQFRISPEPGWSGITDQLKLLDCQLSRMEEYSGRTSPEPQEESMSHTNDAYQKFIAVHVTPKAVRLLERSEWSLQGFPILWEGEGFYSLRPLPDHLFSFGYFKVKTLEEAVEEARLLPDHTSPMYLDRRLLVRKAAPLTRRSKS
jgi:hypothetical protein